MIRDDGSAVSGWLPRGGADATATAAWLRALPPGVRAEARHAPQPVLLLAAAERRLLDGVPPPWPAEPLSDAALRDALDVGTPHPRGMAEVVRRVATASPRRPDAGTEPYALPLPLPVTGGGPGLGTVLGALPARVVVAVGVLPVTLPAAVLAYVDACAERYARLARPAVLRDPGDLYRGAREVEPEPFAAEAAPVYARLALRYREWCARLRVSLLSPEPLDDVTVDRIVAALVPGEPWHEVVRPGADEAAAFVAAVDALGAGGWSRAATGYPALRTLSVVADAEEAATALGLDRAVAAEAPRDRARRALVAACRELERVRPRDRGEEALRDMLLVALAAALPGSAYAEASQGRGRTDLLVRVDGENALVAECKVWHGEAAFTPAVDQLLGYLTARDRYAALVVFGRLRDPAAVAAGALAVLRAHPTYVRDAGATTTTLRTPFATPVDVEVVAVALPAG